MTLCIAWRVMTSQFTMELFSTFSLLQPCRTVLSAASPSASSPSACNALPSTPSLVSLPLSLQIWAQASPLPGSFQSKWGGVSMCSHGTYLWHRAYSSLFVVRYLGFCLPCSRGCEFLEGRCYGSFTSIAFVSSTVPGTKVTFSKFWMEQSLSRIPLWRVTSFGDVMVVKTHLPDISEAFLKTLPVLRI